MTAVQEQRVATTVGAATTQQSGGGRFRRDIEALRGVAVLFVVLYHAGVPLLTGGYVGVDVFFVISGFLITTHLLRSDAGFRALGAFSARRIRRLLPAAALVLVVTVIVARLAGPVLQSSQTAKDALAAAALLSNYRFAAEGLDYLGQGGAESPFLHFWSLAVEEQFYILWPAALFALLLLTRRVPSRFRRFVLGLVVVGGVGASYWASITVTTTDAPLAYYSLQTRAWELGVGAIIAIAAPALLLTPRALSVLFAWAGLIIVVASAFVFDDHTPFPGSAAAVPVLGTAFVIVAGMRSALPLARDAFPAAAVLDRRWLRFVGSVSYTWYLWHWPVLVLAPALFHREFGLPERLAMVVLSFWLAVLTSLLVERPLIGRRGAHLPWFRVGMGVAVVVGVVAGISIAVPPAVPGVSAVAATRSGHATGGPVEPTVLDAKADTPAYPERCILTFTQSAAPSCNITRSGSDRGRAMAGRVVLLGDSHAGQWYPVARALADARNTDVEVLNKVGCPVAEMTVVNSTLKRDYTECDRWRHSVLERLGKEPTPSVVLVSSLNTYRSSDGTSTQAAWRATLGALRTLGSPIVYLADTPHPSDDVPACIAEHAQDWPACAFPRRAAVPDDDLTEWIRSAHPARTTVIDMNALLCPAGADCPAVIGGTLLYRDASHLSDTAVRSLVPDVLDALRTDPLTKSIAPGES